VAAEVAVVVAVVVISTSPQIVKSLLPKFLQTRGCAKEKSLQRPPTIRFTDSVCIEDGIRFIFLQL